MSEREAKKKAVVRRLTLRPSAEVKEQPGGTFNVRLPMECRGGLVELARRRGVSLGVAVAELVREAVGG